MSIWALPTLAQNADEVLGQVHSNGSFRGLVYDEETGKHLAPTYRLLAEQLVNAHERSKALPFPVEPDDLKAPLNFAPYPPLPIRVFQTYRSRVVVILDSGVMEDHPLLEGRLLEVHDFTGEGGGDQCGHGTVQTIRHAFFEPRAKFIVLKVAKRDCRIPLSSLLRALRFLKHRSDFGLVYMAGGVDISTNPDAVLACRAAEEIAAQVGMDRGQFIATTGNAGSQAKWCPAEAEGVTAVRVLDVDTYASELGDAGGQAILQKGPYSSFPDVTPILVGDFLLNTGWLFLEEGELNVALDYAKRAADFPEFTIPAIRLRAAAEWRGPDRRKAFNTLRDGLSQYPDAPVLNAELASVLYHLGEYDEALPVLDAAMAAFPENAQLINTKAHLAEAKGDFGAALDLYQEAAALDPAYLSHLVAYGGRRFYRDDFSQSIAANRAAERIDPTFGAGPYNIAISAALAGDREAAIDEIRRYTPGASLFLLSRDVPDPEAMAPIVTDGSPFQQQVELRYYDGEDRVHSLHFKAFSKLLQQSDEDVSGDLNNRAPEALDSLIVAAVDWSEKLTSRNGAVDLEPAQRLLRRFFDTVDLQRSRRNQAALASALGRIHQREARFIEAVGWYEMAGDLLSLERARDAERAYFLASVAALDAGNLSRAKDLQDRGLSTSTEIYEDDEYGVLLTALTPGLLASQALKALEEGDLDGATDLAERSFLRDQKDLFNGIVLAKTRIAVGREREADEILGSLMRGIINDVEKLDQVEWLFRHHPSLQIKYENGETLAGAYDFARTATAQSKVLLSPAVSFDFENFHDRENQVWAFPFGECVEDQFDSARSPNLTVVVGTGIMDIHPCLDRSVVGKYDFMGGDGTDRNGATTAQAMYLVQFGSLPQQIVSLRVLNDEGRGSVDALTRAFAAIVVIEPDTVLTHIETDSFDRQMMGLARRAAGKTMIIAQAPEQGAGRIYPMSVAEEILVVR